MADDKKPILGPGAKGDPENPAVAPSRVTSTTVQDQTVEEVTTKVEQGELDRRAALQAERQSGDPRTTLIDKLESKE